MQIPEESEPNLEINIVPMIDVIFSILAFFIISTLFLTQSQGLPVDLPEATTAQQQPETEVTVTIEANGDLALNKEPISLKQLVTEIKQISQKHQETTVIVKADKAVAHGEVVSVMDQLRQVEGVKLAIATVSPSK